MNANSIADPQHPWGTAGSAASEARGTGRSPMNKLRWASLFFLLTAGFVVWDRDWSWLTVLTVAVDVVGALVFWFAGNERTDA